MKKRGNGEGSIFQNKKLNKWVGQYTVNGKRKAVYGNTRKEVKEKLISALSSIQDGSYINKNNITVLQLLKDIENTKLSANLIKESTYARNMDTIKHIENSKLCNIKVQDINSSMLQSFLNEKLELSQSTIDKIYQTLNSGFRKAIDEEIILKNPISKVIKPISRKIKKDISAFTLEEQIKLIQYLNTNADTTFKNLILISLFTGARAGEIGALTYNDVDFKNQTITINKTLTKDKNYKVIMGDSTKTGRTKKDSVGKREIPFQICQNGFLEKILREQIQISKNVFNNKNNLLFCKLNGNYIVPSEINNNFKVICKNAKIKVIQTQRKKDKDIVVNLKSSSVNFHMCRHTFATRCIESGMDPVVLSKLLGHSKVQTTLDIYVDVFDKFRDKKLEELNNYYKINKICL